MNPLRIDIDNNTDTTPSINTLTIKVLSILSITMERMVQVSNFIK